MKTVKNASGILISKLNGKRKYLIIGIIVLLVTIILLFFIKHLIQINKPLTCKVTGCSGQLCVPSDTENIVTTCEWKEEYKCYKQAKCEVQSNNTCGFTKDEKFKECLKSVMPIIKEVRPI